MYKYYCNDTEGNICQVLIWIEELNEYKNGIACYASKVRPIDKGKGCIHIEIIPITEYFEIIDRRQIYLPPYRVDFKEKVK